LRSAINSSSGLRHGLDRKAVDSARAEREGIRPNRASDIEMREREACLAEAREASEKPA